MLMAKAEGFFTNNEDFFGPNRKEFLHITVKDGFWQGLKIVGDTNVPRGKVSFRAIEKDSNINDLTPAKIQIRSETWNEAGFSWMDGASVRFDSNTDKWYINFMCGSFSFSRCTQQEALDAAQGPDNV
eukprot:TRINITY_DN13007_c0_g1_i1.p1 TRINITY_DN13007_c0_g1~~TRINITY_DN13007_c0_g1_i1.p1  ORF type:complete len:128 (-),score=19.07 TRINITY_DN13007_c0_g1_i1:83-466(-)